MRAILLATVVIGVAIGINTVGTAEPDQQPPAASKATCQCDPTVLAALQAEVAELKKQVAGVKPCQCEAPTPAKQSERPETKSVLVEPTVKHSLTVGDVTWDRPTSGSYRTFTAPNGKPYYQIISSAPAGWSCGPNGCTYNAPRTGWFRR